MTTWCHLPCMSWACCTNRKATSRKPSLLLKMPSKCFPPIQSPYDYRWLHLMKCLLLDDVLSQNQTNTKDNDKNEYPKAKFDLLCCEAVVLKRFIKFTPFPKNNKKLG